MKKLIICLAIATVAVSCKKIQAGGNKGTLKLEDGVERYSDDHQGGHDGHSAEPAHATPAHGAHETEAPKKDNATAKPTDSAKTKAGH